MRNMIGQQIGPYKIEELIGAGGMADVYRAHQGNLDRYVAIKVLKASLADDPQFVARFSREAMASGGLRHPNILRIYDAGTHEGRHYIVMDYASGSTLAQRAEKRPLSIDEVATLGIQIAEALDYAHKRPHPIIHRDLKPSNILLDDDRPLLADFGIAYIVSKEKRLTETGASLGTPEYMSPEQSEGFPVDGRTDIYSLGVILFQLVTGRVPFEANTPLATMHQVVYTLPPRPRQLKSDVPEWMESIILRALAKRPEDRFATAGEMAEALRKRQVVPVAAESASAPAGLTQVALHVKRPAPATATENRPRDVERTGMGRTPIVALLVAGALVVLGGVAFLAMPALRGARAAVSKWLRALHLLLQRPRPCPHRRRCRLRSRPSPSATQPRPPRKRKSRPSSRPPHRPRRHPARCRRLTRRRRPSRRLLPLRRHRPILRCRPLTRLCRRRAHRQCRVVHLPRRKSCPQAPRHPPRHPPHQGSSWVSRLSETGNWVTSRTAA